MKIQDIVSHERDLMEADEDKGNAKLVDDVVEKIGDSVDVTVYDDGENFNIAFEGDGVEYYIRPNDQGDELFYIDADADDFESFKVKDMDELKKKVKEISD